MYRRLRAMIESAREEQPRGYEDYAKSGDADKKDAVAKLAPFTTSVRQLFMAYMSLASNDVFPSPKIMPLKSRNKDSTYMMYTTINVAPGNGFMIPSFSVQTKLRSYYARVANSVSRSGYGILAGMYVRPINGTRMELGIAVTRDEK